MSAVSRELEEQIEACVYCDKKKEIDGRSCTFCGDSFRACAECSEYWTICPACASA
jgi:hypothetical protein